MKVLCCHGSIIARTSHFLALDIHYELYLYPLNYRFTIFIVAFCVDVSRLYRCIYISILFRIVFPVSN